MTDKPEGNLEGGSTHYRPDIQGLRTVAVTAVAFFHLWPTSLPGGFVGVDVFFVISGFLITGHLLREVRATNTVDLFGFWGRRIRRLLPASFLVLAVTTVATYLLVPRDLWSGYFKQIRASALYYQNWQLASDAVDYMAIDAKPTAVQHFWSLSVEEQFYLVWPLLIIACVAIASRVFRAHSPEKVLVPTLGFVALASLGYSAIATAIDQSWAYFASFTRVWELAAGGLVALAYGRWLERVRGSVLSAVLSWMGLAMILISTLHFNGQTAFPGLFALVPVVGTVLLLLFGETTIRFSPRPLLEWRPVVWIGGISYAVYLWHWGPIVILPLVTGEPLTELQKVAIVGFTLLAAALSTKYFETPLRRSALLATSRNAVVFAIVGGLAFTVVTAMTEKYLSDVRATSEQATSHEVLAPCVGPGALDPRNRCGDPMGAGDYVVKPETVALQNQSIEFGDCQQDAKGTEPITCSLGTQRDPTKRLIITGDSHATQWLQLFDQVGKEEGWSVATYTKSGCPLTLTRRTVTTEQNLVKASACDAWVDATLQRIVDSDADTVVITSYQSRYGWIERSKGPWYPNPVDGFAAVMEKIADSGKRVVVIKAIPRTNDLSVPGCLIEKGRDARECGSPRSEALPRDVMEQAARQLDRPDVVVANLDNQFCDTKWCYPVVGNMVVYRDSSHLSTQYAMALGRWLIPQVDPK